MEKKPDKKVEPKITLVPSAWLKMKMQKWEEWRKLETPASAPMSAPAPTI